MSEKNVMAAIPVIRINMVANSEPAVSRKVLLEICDLVEALVGERDALKAQVAELSDATRPKAKPPTPPRPTPHAIVEGPLWSWPERVFFGLMALFVGSMCVALTIMLWLMMWRFVVAGGCV